MRKIKHKKIKNTGILYEMLIRHMTSELMNNSDQKSYNIINKFFKKGTELNKEFSIYNTLVSEKFASPQTANNLLEAVKKVYNKLDKAKLEKEKYSLNKVINENYTQKDFFNTKIEDYSLFASIYNYLEYEEEDNPGEIVRNKVTIIENICKQDSKRESVEDYFSGEDKELRYLAFKLLIEKFNKKWTNLNDKQKQLLAVYVNNPSNNKEATEYVLNEANILKNRISFYEKRVTDKVLKIKLHEVNSLLGKMGDKILEKDDYLVAMLRYYELIDELNNMSK